MDVLQPRLTCVPQTTYPHVRVLRLLADLSEGSQPDRAYTKYKELCQSVCISVLGALATHVDERGPAPSLCAGLA
jgi:hypothetical protein